MASPFTIALELAWSDGGLSGDGARLLEDVQAFLHMDDCRRQAVEEPWLDDVLPERRRKGFGSGDAELRTWLEGLRSIDPAILERDAAGLGRSALENGISKSAWADAYEWATDMGCDLAFAEGVWAERQAAAGQGWLADLAPMAGILGLGADEEE